MRITLTIDDDVLDLARELASQNKCTLGSALSELVRRGFPPAHPTMNEQGIPVFGVAPHAKSITDEAVYRALDKWP